jgi:tetratricopeptide (TPR) repeat protein
MLPRVKEQPALEAQLLIWKAQALLTMSCADRALVAANRSWELHESPHACHLMASCQQALGQTDEPVRLLRLGWQLFPDAVHLPVQLAMMLADQGRMHEALQVLDDLLSTRPEVPPDLEVFLFGFRANLLASTGRWDEADDLLQDGLDCYPDSELLHEAHGTLTEAWLKLRCEEALADSWAETIDPLEGVAAEVDEAITRSGHLAERSELEVLAARRLWRAFMVAQQPRIQALESWGAAALLAVAELDGDRPSAAAIAHMMGARPGTVRSALARLRTYISGLEPQLALRSFAAHGNPRLENPYSNPENNERDNVLDFPTRRLV